MKKVYILIIAVFVMNCAQGQVWTNYTTADGLATNSCEAITIDKNGNIWVVDGGVAKFDGNTWVSYTTADGLCPGYDYDIEPDGYGNIWTGCYQNSASKFDGTSWIKYHVTDSTMGCYVKCIKTDLQGKVWFGTYYGGVVMFDGTNWTTYTSTNTSNGLPDDDVTSIAIDANGIKWFGSSGHYVTKFDGANWFTFPSFSTGIYDISIDSHGDVWCTTYPLGIPNCCYLLRYDGVNWQTIITPNNNYDKIAIDLEGNIWLATWTRILKFDGFSWTSVSPDLNTNYTDIAIDALGNKWITSDKGVWKYSDGGAGPVGSGCIIKGKVFNDSNGNGIQDNGEIVLSSKALEVINDSTFITTQNNGVYAICRDTGSYTIKCLDKTNWQFTTDSIKTVYVNNTTKLIDNVDFGVKLRPAISDVSVSIAGSPALRNFNNNYWLNYSNMASVPKSGDVLFTFDTNTTFVSSIPPPDLQNGNTLTWNYNNLLSLEQRQIKIILHTSGLNQLGDTLRMTALINPIIGDNVPLNNCDILKNVVVGSYDPNDKIVDKGEGPNGITVPGSELNYTIHFQNTGTASAQLVQIRDTIDAHMDITSLRILSSSHNVRLDIKGHNVVTFIFENINLPDSGANLSGSNGFVKFAISPKVGLPENTVVRNKAYIYFDYNVPVLTNQVINTYINSSTAVNNYAYEETDIYPNPVQNEFYVEYSGELNGQVIVTELYNVYGALVKEVHVGNKNKFVVSTRELPSGIYYYRVRLGNNVVGKDKIVIMK